MGQILDWSPGMRIGGGYDVVSGEAKQEAVVGTVEKPINAAGQEGKGSFMLATSSDEVDKALDISASIKVGVGPFGGSAKMQFHEKCKVSNQATFCVISVNATNAYEQLVKPKLAPEAIELLAAGKTDRFRERFGDQFISGQFSGVDFHGVVRIEASTVARQIELAAQVEASYGVAVSGEANASSKVQMSSSNHRIEVLLYQKGGEVSLCKSVDEMLAAAKQALVDGRSGKGYPFQVTIDPYTELELPNDNASLIDTDMAAKSVKAALAYIADLRTLLNDIDYVRRNPSWYVPEEFDIKNLNEQAKKITAEINRLWAAADVCSKHFDRCEMTVPDFPEVILPQRKDGAPQPVPSKPESGSAPGVAGRLKGMRYLEGWSVARSPLALANLEKAESLKVLIKPAP